MNCYKIVIEGNNCWANIDGTVKRLGFFTTRAVTALNVDQAKKTILREISEELRSCIINHSFNPPEIMVDETTEIGLTEAGEISNAGFTWYQEDTTPPN